MTYIAVFLVLLFAYYVLRTYIWQFKATRAETETDAVVSWIEKSVRSAHGESFTYCYYYARYRKENGLEAEAVLWNPKRELMKGSRIKIRYLPQKDQYAVLTEILET